MTGTMRVIQKINRNFCPFFFKRSVRLFQRVYGMQRLENELHIRIVLCKAAYVTILLCNLNFIAHKINLSPFFSAEKLTFGSKYL